MKMPQRTIILISLRKHQLQVLDPLKTLHTCLTII